MEIWQNLEKNATEILMSLPHFMWAENNKFNVYIASKIGYKSFRFLVVGCFKEDLRKKYLVNHINNTLIHG